MNDWREQAAFEIEEEIRHGSLTSGDITAIIIRHSPEPPLLICIHCSNTESCAGAMAREFNQGRCLHCGGYFRVYRA